MITISIPDLVDDEKLVTYSPSQIGVWKDCPQKWEYNYGKGLRKAGSTKALDIGTYFHELSHVYYNTIEQTNHKPGSTFLQDMMRARLRSDISRITPDNLEVVNIVSKMILKFIEKQSPIIDGNIGKILGVEKEFKVKVSTPKGRWVLLHGIIDLVYLTKGGKLKVRDHKTSQQINAWNQRKLSLDQQLMLYAVAMTLEQGRPAYDVEINFINTYQYANQRPLTDLFKLIPWTYTPIALEKATERVLSLIDIMLDTPVYRNYSKECSGCSYYDLCELEIRGLDTTRVELSSYVKRDTKSEPGPKVAEFFKEASDASEYPTNTTNVEPFKFDLR